MNTKHTDVVAEYLHEVDLRLSGLPVLQRRELLADLAAHVATERTERNIRTEGELIEVLERLGSPEVVAAAAYEEAGPYRPVPTAPVRRPLRWQWPAAAIAVAVLLVSIILCGLMLFAHGARSAPEPARPVPGDVAPPRLTR